MVNRVQLDTIENRRLHFFFTSRNLTVKRKFDSMRVCEAQLAVACKPFEVFFIVA